MFWTFDDSLHQEKVVHLTLCALSPLSNEILGFTCHVIPADLFAVNIAFNPAFQGGGGARTRATVFDRKAL